MGNKAPATHVFCEVAPVLAGDAGEGFFIREQSSRYDGPQQSIMRAGPMQVDRLQSSKIASANLSQFNEHYRLDWTKRAEGATGRPGVGVQ